MSPFYFKEKEGRALMIRRHSGLVLLAAAVCLLFAGCASEGKRYDVETEVITTQDFNAKDLQLIVKNSVGLLVPKAELDLGADPFSGRPRVYVAPVANNTDEHIETSIIRQFLESEITDKANVRLVDRDRAQQYAAEELRFQQGDLVDPASAQAVGKILGAEYFLYAELSSHRAVTRSRRAESQLFFFSLSLIKVETLEKVPVTYQIQKVAKKGHFGW